MIDPEQQRWDTTLNEIEKKAEEDHFANAISGHENYQRKWTARINVVHKAHRY